jgi:hypothetical protein
VTAYRILWGSKTAKFATLTLGYLHGNDSAECYINCTVLRVCSRDFTLNSNSGKELKFEILLIPYITITFGIGI